MKKTVHFTHFNGWRNHPSGAVQALLGGVKDHYRLGDVGDVITSAVVRIDYPTDLTDRTPALIETLNTIYVRDAQ